MFISEPMFGILQNNIKIYFSVIYFLEQLNLPGDISYFCIKVRIISCRYQWSWNAKNSIRESVNTIIVAMFKRFDNLLGGHISYYNMVSDEGITGLNRHCK